MSAFDFVAPVVMTFELHVGGDPEFTRKSWGRKVRDLGGRYSECRGYASTETRFVFLPNTSPGRALAAEILCAFPGPIMGPRDGGVVILRDIEGACAPRDAGGGVVFNVTSRGRPAADVLAEIGKRLSRFEDRCREWWDRVGRERAELAAAESARREDERKASAPGRVADAIREALALGCSREDILGAIEASLSPKEQGS